MGLATLSCERSICPALGQRTRNNGRCCKFPFTICASATRFGTCAAWRCCGLEGRAAPGTSIVAVSSTAEGKKFAWNSRPAAGFLAQLIATAQQAPQTRQRRQAEGPDVVARYATAIAPYAATGRTLRSTI